MLRRRIRQIGFLLFLLLSPLVFTQCLEPESDAVTGGGDEAAGVIETEVVGTNVGNPTTPTKNSVMFITSTDVQGIDDVVIDVAANEAADPTQSEIPASNEAFPVASEGCMPIIQPEKGLVSQQCHVTPELRMGVAALWLVDCADADGVPIFCHHKLATSVTQRVELYNGEPVDMAISSTGTELAVNDIAETITARGLQMVTTYLEVKLPDTDKMISYLRGKSFHICTSSDLLDAATREAYCDGTSGIQFGQVTFDIDGDGIFGFIDLTTLTSDFAEETLEPPSDPKYDEFANSFLRVLKLEATSLDIAPGYYPFTDTSFYDVAGFYAPLIPTFSSQEISPDATHKFTVSFDVTDVLKYVDGMMGHILGLPVCVEGVIPDKTTCNGTTSDEGSFGTYNPYYDAGPYIESPKVEFLIE